MKDFLGHEVQPTSLGLKPRGGQWVKFRLNDVNKQVALASQGAFTARDTSLVGIFQAAHTPPMVTITRKDGTKEISGGELIPDRIVLVHADGHNLPVGVRDAKGHMQVTDIFFFLDSPNVKDVQPVDDLNDLPPGRVVHTKWAEQLHNTGKEEKDHILLPAEWHEQCKHSHRVEELLKAHADSVKE